MTIRIASFNVENLFARPRVFRTSGWTAAIPVLDAYERVNKLFKKANYSPDDREEMRELLLKLDIYSRNSSGAIRRKYTATPRWAWLRTNRGSFDREPKDKTEDVEIVAEGRDSWLGWVELAVEPTDETTVRMTAKVIDDVGADILGVIEAEDRPSLVRFNDELLSRKYEHIMLVDGNDERGIDVGILTREGFAIETIRSNVDAKDDEGEIFSRDCPQYEIIAPSGMALHVLVNHFKSQSGGGGPKRRRQARRVRQIVDGLVEAGKHVVVMGDLNEGPTAEGQQAENFDRLFKFDSPLLDCYGLSGFDTGARPGTYDSCGIRNRLDYVLISKSLEPHFEKGGIFRKGLWGTRKTRPDKWETYLEIESGDQQASDHAAVWIDLNI